MKIVTDISITARPMRVGRSFDPSMLFAGGIAGGAYAATSPSKVFSDQAGQVQAQIGQSVARVHDIGPNLQHMIQPSAAMRPLLGRAPVGAAPGGPIDQGSGPSFLRFDLSDDVLPTTFHDGGTFDVMVFGREGSWIERDVTIASAGSLSVGPRSVTGGAEGLLASVGDIVGWIAVGRTLTGTEVARLVAFYKAFGAKGLLVPGPELVDIDNLPDPSVSHVDGGGIWNAATRTMSTNSAGTNASYPRFAFDFGLEPGRRYRVQGLLSGDTDKLGNVLFQRIRLATQGSNNPVGYDAASGAFSATQVAADSVMQIQLNGTQHPVNVSVEELSIRELRPEEDW